MRTEFIGVRDRLDVASTLDLLWRRAASEEWAEGSMEAADFMAVDFTVVAVGSTVAAVGSTADDVTFGGGSTTQDRAFF